jgi:hypothetical protein
MKKEKIILTGIAILAVVGGALAFKAKRTPFLAYAITSQTTTSFVINGLTYRTIVHVCLFTGKFIDPNGVILGPTMTDVFKPVTGYSTLNGLPVTATTLEFVCTPTWTATTFEF